MFSLALPPSAARPKKMCSLLASVPQASKQTLGQKTLRDPFGKRACPSTKSVQVFRWSLTLLLLMCLSLATQAVFRALCPWGHHQNMETWVLSRSLGPWRSLWGPGGLHESARIDPVTAASGEPVVVILPPSNFVSSPNLVRFELSTLVHPVPLGGCSFVCVVVMVACSLDVVVIDAGMRRCGCGKNDVSWGHMI